MTNERSQNFTLKYIVINGDNVRIPIITVRQEEYVPCLYFEATADEMDLTSIHVRGQWKEELKGHMKSQGLKKKYLDLENIECVRLVELKEMFEEGDTFQYV